MEKKMTKLKLLSAGLIAAAMFATPAMARQHHAASRYPAANTDVSAAPDARYIAGQACYPAPRVGAFATAPWDNDTPCLPAQAPAY
jgi:hypothetical protein